MHTMANLTSFATDAKRQKLQDPARTLGATLISDVVQLTGEAATTMQIG